MATGALERDIKIAAEQEAILSNKIRSSNEVNKPLWALLLDQTKKVNNIRKEHLNMCKDNASCHSSEPQQSRGKGQSKTQNRHMQSRS
jgi:hypothetical protein